MFTSMNSTDEWELDSEDVVTVQRHIMNALREDGNTLYALRKLGMVSAGQEAAAIEFLKGESIE